VGDFSWEKIAQGIRNGACIATSGPMLRFSVDNKDPGFEFPADGRMHEVSLHIWSGPLPGETLVSVQVIRNGEVVQAWDLHSMKIREWTGSCRIGDTNFAWYSIRVLSTCNDPESTSAWTPPAELYDMAVASPVYFLPAGFERPVPAKAKIRLHVRDEANNPVNATISVVGYGEKISDISTDAKGYAFIIAPPTASLVISAPGYSDITRNIFMDSPVYGFCKDFNDFYSPGGFNYLRNMLENLSFDVTLRIKSN
jgi:hypothetical protein